MKLINRILISVVATGLSVAPPFAATAQIGFHQVSPTGSYITTSPFDAPSNPLFINLAGLGNTINLLPSGILRVAGMGSPDHNALFCGVFSTSTQLLSPGSANRVVGAIGSGGGAPCVTGPTFYFGMPTDITQDFFIPETGVNVFVPHGANYLILAVPDDQYADNVTPDQSSYGVTVSSVVPEPSTYAMMAIGLFGVVLVHRRKRSQFSNQ